jgi:hypothetical protein
MSIRNSPIRAATSQSLPEPNAIYRPKGTPVFLALNRNPEELMDIRGVAGYLREGSRLPKGMILFTPDGFVPADDEYTYRMHRRDFEYIYE